MTRIIRSAILALLCSSGALFAQQHAGGRSHVTFIPFYRYEPTFVPSVVPVPVPYPVPNPVPYVAPTVVAPTTAPYLFVGNNSSARPQLVFKDGTIYTVTDYWRTDDQLHFMTTEEGGSKSVPHSVPFDTLDLERTKKAAALEGFRFVLRDKPLDEWLGGRGEKAARRHANQ